MSMFTAAVKDGRFTAGFMPAPAERVKLEAPKGQEMDRFFTPDRSRDGAGVREPGAVLYQIIVRVADII